MKYSLALVSAAALALVNAADDCISTCEQTAADSLGCDLSDVAGCICQSTFATQAKACLYETDGCGATYVSQMYESVNSLCADSTGTATTTSTAATATGGSDDCIASCEATAASSLGCDLSDLAGCFCLADFATAAKACLYHSDVAGFYSEYNSACASVSEATTVAGTTVATATEQTSVTPTAGETIVAPVSSAEVEPSETTSAGVAPTSLATSTTAVASNGTSVTSSPTGFVTAGASGLREGGMAFAAAVAIGGGLAALI